MHKNAQERNFLGSKVLTPHPILIHSAQFVLMAAFVSYPPQE